MRLLPHCSEMSINIHAVVHHGRFYSANIVKKEVIPGHSLKCDLLKLFANKLEMSLEPVTYTEEEITI